MSDGAGPLATSPDCRDHCIPHLCFRGVQVRKGQLEDIGTCLGATQGCSPTDLSLQLGIITCCLCTPPFPADKDAMKPNTSKISRCSDTAGGGTDERNRGW